MNEKNANYNLLGEKWIPILWKDGNTNRVGIIEALTQADRIRQIAASNPMDRMAIIRFLLALLYWCKGNPPEDSKENIGDSFPADWFKKLDDNKDCFNLLGEGKRFYQDPNARRSRTATDLIQEIPAGNNFWHFRHSTDEKDGLCSACCAMGLLRLPLFSVSGLPDLKSGINGSPPIYVVPWGKSLFETLRLNWLPCTNLGVPAWVQPDILLRPGEDVPLLTGLTLLSRRVLLHKPSTPEGICIGCGANEKVLIRTCEFQSAGKQENERWDDPHVLYFEKTPRKAIRAPDLTVDNFRMDRPWLNLLTRVIETLKFGFQDKPTSLLIVGFATDKAKNIDAWERTIVVPPGRSINSISASLIQQWRKQGWILEKHIENIMRSENEGKSCIAAIRPDVENKVSYNAGELLVNEAAWEKASREYSPMMEMIAKSLSPGFTTAALEKRQHIANTIPDMRPETEADKNPDGRKEVTNERNGKIH